MSDFDEMMKFKPDCKGGGVLKVGDDRLKNATDLKPVFEGMPDLKGSSHNRKKPKC